jgi:hypothetical protein
MSKQNLYKTNLTYSEINNIKDPYNLTSYSIEKYVIPTSLNDPYNRITSQNYSKENFVPIDFGGIVGKKELKQVVNNAAVQQQIIAQHKKQDLIAAEKQVKSDKIKRLQVLVAEHRARSGDLVKSADQLQREVKDLQKTLDINGNEY